MVVSAVHPYAKYHYGKWKVHVVSQHPQHMDLLGFLRSVTRHYLRIKDGDAAQQSTSAAATSKPPPSIMKETWGDFPQKLEKQRRCSECHARVRWACKKCQITLCIERKCFEAFHKKKINSKFSLKLLFVF